ncbi:hypothetical protein GCM10009783_25010 [Glycomyces lechevalierae]
MTKRSRPIRAGTAVVVPPERCGVEAGGGGPPGQSPPPVVYRAVPVRLEPLRVIW